MPRSGHAYPITNEWKQLVKDRLKEMGISQNELGRRAKISKAAMSQTFAEKSVQSTVAPQIHAALGWPPPLLCPPLYVLQLVAAFESLPERMQGEWLERLRNAVADAKSRR